MTSQFQRDALAPLVSMMHDIIVDYRASHVPRESKFGGSGVTDGTLQGASTNKAHAITGKNGDTIRDNETYHPNDLLNNADENAASCGETFGVENPHQYVLVHLL